EWDEIIIMVSTALIAVWLMAAAFEGYLNKAGTIGWLVRVPLLVAAACLLYPEGVSKIAGVVLVAICYAIALFQRKSVAA
ncbi:MAG: hypothetical protein QGG28_19190, partial [Alphaproteobacteria bacterium]|nr:hypothetical protein [Alphaproteobacteria bacterium]